MDMINGLVEAKEQLFLEAIIKGQYDKAKDMLAKGKSTKTSKQLIELNQEFYNARNQ